MGIFFDEFAKVWCIKIPPVPKNDASRIGAIFFGERRAKSAEKGPDLAQKRPKKGSILAHFLPHFWPHFWPIFWRHF